jgi:hypothetical protein
MGDPAKNIPFYRQMIFYLGQAFAMLDEAGKADVLQFIAGQQNPDGGFCDRGKRSDLYYSLFAGMMLEAGESLQNSPEGDFGDGFRNSSVLEQGQSQSDIEARHPMKRTRNPQQLFRNYLSNQSSAEIPGFIEQCCLVLLQQNFNLRVFSKLKSVLAVAKSFWKERSSINLSYRSFVLFLTLDAVLPVRWLLKAAAKRILNRTTVDADSPCSEIAAKVFLLKITNHDGKNEQKLLTSFACETGGFRAFRHVEHADMLSTAVSLFALKFSGADLRLLKPGCLDFIQENYAEGAFLSGDGDPTKDLEYTFYGMLALGVLAG